MVQNQEKSNQKALNTLKKQIELLEQEREILNNRLKKALD